MRKYRIAPYPYVSGEWCIEVWRRWWPFWVRRGHCGIPTLEDALRVVGVIQAEFSERGRPDENEAE